MTFDPAWIITSPRLEGGADFQIRADQTFQATVERAYALARAMPGKTIEIWELKTTVMVPYGDAVFDTEVGPEPNAEITAADAEYATTGELHEDDKENPEEAEAAPAEEDPARSGGGV